MKFDSEDSFYPRLSGQDDDRAASSALPRSRRRVALVGCFRPRLCGIATFTADSYDYLRRQRPDLDIDIYAMRAAAHDADDPDICFAIDEPNAESYRRAADAINASGADVLWLQHEFGIFGGPAGELVLELLDRVAAPIVVTLHTVLAEPNDEQRRVTLRLVSRASRLVVMSDFGRRTLVDVFGADPDRIAHIEHGTPDRPLREMSHLRTQFGIGDRPVLSTFGLLGSGKGLETAIRALPAIAAQFPDVLYRIVGATHPNLVAAEGEAYRESLVALADSLGVSGNIAWDNRFLGIEDLLDQIELCDVYIAPYPNLAQVTSGTLAYAVALGRAVVSTPFVHAKELLAGDVGILVPPSDSDAIAEAVRLLLSVPEERRAIGARAYARGRRTTWPEIAKQCGAVLDAAMVRPSKARHIRGAPNPSGVWAMCDDVGMLQHGIGIIPDRNHGYCLDDNVRALMFANNLRVPSEADELRSLRFASFIQHAWNPDASAFRNFMGYDRRWLEDIGSEDSNGRALWALGHTSARAQSAELRGWARDWFERSSVMADGFKSPRALAFALLGADELLASDPDHGAARAIVERAGAFLHALWKSGRRPEWDWFEPVLAYDNARLAEALLRAGRRLPSLPLEEAGLAALDWICTRQTSVEGRFRPVGCDGFGRPGTIFAFDQQPLEAWSTIEACGLAHKLSGNDLWRTRAEAAWRWYLGENDRAAPLGDSVSGRCRDGITARGLNLNVGAESLLSYHLSHQAMARFFWSERELSAVPAAPRTSRFPIAVGR